MLSYTSCSMFYKCPYLFHNRDDTANYVTKAMELGANIDYMLNLLMVKHIENKETKERCIEELGFQEMAVKMADNNDVCTMFDVPEMVKLWYIDFLQSGYEVIDVQPHFVIEELDYHGYADAIFADKGELIVVENKTTSRYYDKFFSSKKNSMQAVGYALGFGTNQIRYQFFNTKNMSDYCSYSRFVTEQNVKEFKDWVNFVKDNQSCMVKNTEWCSLNECPLREMCMMDEL